MYSNRVRLLSGLSILACCFAGCGGRSADMGKVLTIQDDFELCDKLFLLLTDRHGDNFDVSKCDEKEETVMLVWHASGIIDNGGFQYLFEGSFNGDPDFARTAKAFKAIKAKKCAAAVGEALALFPGSKPPANIEKRLQTYQSVGASKRGAIDEKFFSESKEIRTYLARYIRDNSEEFKKLK
jgi:Domain of unknown function (DUF4375)